MQNKLATLIALAKRPERRATLDELREEAAAAEADKTIGRARQLHSFDHIDIFESGLVVAEGDSLLITENGCSLLRALGIVTHEPADFDPLSTVQSLNLIDDLIGPEAHRKIFDFPSPVDDPEADGLHEATVSPAAPPDRAGMDGPAHEAGDDSSVSAPHAAGQGPPEPPAFLTAKFGSGVQGPPQSPDLRTRIAALLNRGGNAWRNHLRQDQPRAAAARSSTNVERILFALLGLLVFAGAAFAVFALVQVRDTRSELAALQRELPPLRERLGRLEQIERSRDAPDKAGTPKRQSPVEDRVAEAPLLLSREEIQLIRDYIKPAPLAGSALPPVAVGDPVTGPTLAFPSPVTEKVPRLLGARFTIRHGAIVILSKDGRRADAVLGQN